MSVSPAVHSLICLLMPNCLVCGPLICCLCGSIECLNATCSPANVNFFLGNCWWLFSLHRPHSLYPQHFTSRFSSCLVKYVFFRIRFWSWLMLVMNFMYDWLGTWFQHWQCGVDYLGYVWIIWIVLNRGFSLNFHFVLITSIYSTMILVLWSRTL